MLVFVRMLPRDQVPKRGNDELTLGLLFHLGACLGCRESCLEYRCRNPMKVPTMALGSRENVRSSVEEALHDLPTSPSKPFVAIIYGKSGQTVQDQSMFYISGVDLRANQSCHCSFTARLPNHGTTQIQRSAIGYAHVGLMSG